MPPRTQAFSSCTSPWMMRCRKLRSSAVGGICARTSFGRLKAVLPIPRGATIRRFVRDPFEGDTKKGESNVTVFGARSRIGGERHGERCAQQLVASPRLKEQLFIRGQSGGMG